MLTRRQLLGALLGASAAFALPPTGRGPMLVDSVLADGPVGTLVVPRGRDLVLVQADGSGERTLLTLEPGGFAADGAWSPDGGRIAFSRYAPPTTDDAGGADLLVVSAQDGAGPPAVLVPRERAGTLLAAPAWAPDGGGLAFETVGLTAVGGIVARVDWVMADGSGRRTLAEGGRNPTISPDGSTLAYLKTISNGDGLWTRPLGGGPERQVVAEYELLALAFPRFSPDGRSFAFAGVGDLGRSSRTAVERATGYAALRASLHGIPWDLFGVDADGKNLRRLALVGEDDGAVAWSPDGRWIAVAGGGGVHIFSPSDGAVRTVSLISSYGAIDWR